MHRWVRNIPVALAGCVLFSALAYAGTINSFSAMPANATAIYPNFLSEFDPNSFQTQLRANNISIEVWHIYDGWVKGCCSGYYAFHPGGDPESTIAPFNDYLITDAVRLTFGNPVSAFGATFFATANPPTDDPNTSGLSQRVHYYGRGGWGRSTSTGWGERWRSRR